MGLTTSQSIVYQRIRASSTSKQAVSLSDDAVRAIIAIAARDMRLAHRFPELPEDVPELFSPRFRDDYRLPGPDPRELFERLCRFRPDADTYVACLASLHKARLKYRQVLATQPFAHMNQVGPRGLLQYGLVEAPALAALLVWRKWFYDVDNRAAQDTGYLVEPVIAGALGGASYSARASPIRRTSNPDLGRQVDCVKGDRAYEFKLRITIAASGQGRWAEEISFVEDARTSGYEPVLVVLDPTSSVKLAQLKAKFEAAGGLCYVGDEAWSHLYEEAQPDMRSFLEKYIETPLRALFGALSPDAPLPSLEVHDSRDRVEFAVGDYTWVVDRSPVDAGIDPQGGVPHEAGEFLPGLD